MTDRRRSLTNRVRRFLGLCPHWWSAWGPLRCASADPIQFMADDKIEIGRQRECHLCGNSQREFFPEGH